MAELAGCSKLEFNTFKCDKSSESLDLCAQIGLTGVPAWVYVGAGDFYDRSPFKRLREGHKWEARLTTFKGLEHDAMKPVRLAGNEIVWVPAALSSWVSLMQRISGAQRHWQSLVRLFTGQARADTSDHTKLIEALRDENHRLSEQSGTTIEEDDADTQAYESLGQQWAEEASDQDPFTQLAKDGFFSPGAKPIRLCVTDQTQQYCEHWADNPEALPREEPYCEQLAICAASSWKHSQCRPKQCPFENMFGCYWLAECMDPPKEYSQM